MAFLTKKNILKAYKTLTEMNADPTLQGATQIVSAVRYFIALDRFYVEYKRSCNTRDGSDKAKFIEYVGEVCAVSDDLYTANFYYPLKSHIGDYCVGSNFYSAGQVNASLVNKELLLDYPKRGNNPLFSIKGGVLLQNLEYYSNINFYLKSTELKVAMVVWLLRKDNIENENNKSLIDNIYSSMAKKYSSYLLDILFDDLDKFKDVVNTYNIVFTNDGVDSLVDDDIKKLYDINTDTESNTQKDSHSLQQIFYGAPGTGKSHYVDNVTTKDNSIRTTFHPDSDYASFVGAYKPKMEQEREETFASDNYSLFELTSILSQFYAKSQGPNKDIIRPCQVFGAKYWRSLEKLDSKDIQKIVDTVYSASGSPMKGEVDKGITVGKFLFEDLKKEQIVYKFVPQAFLKAYVKAWKWYAEDINKIEEEKRPFYLVIEEINRGNCAQIFGDLFQLLDRSKNGYSSYAIDSDTDIQNYLEDDGFVKLDISSFTGKITNDGGKEIATIKDIKNGTAMVLPPNLYIWATMNTSDQSLFPIDSAFKRRWDWEYRPINYANTDWIIQIGNLSYSWVDFQKEINKRIYDIDNSEDKQLGDFFVNPHDGIITADILLNKILFYIWNDVCKDDSERIFKVKTQQGENAITFSGFFCPEKEEKLQELMAYIKVEPLNGNNQEVSEPQSEQSIQNLNTNE